MMNESELARSVAAEYGNEVIAALDRDTSDTRSIGMSEALAIASLIASAAQIALDVWRANRDRSLMMQSLVEKSPSYPSLDQERRLSVIASTVDKAIPEGPDAYPTLTRSYAKSKQEWLHDWLGLGTRTFSPTVLMPFADMDHFIVFKPIAWKPPEHASTGLPGMVTIPEGFVTDLASIPAYFWFALPPTGRYGHAAILHDWLYWDQQTSRETADRIFDIAMDELDVALPIRKAMWAAVRVKGGNYWSDATKEKSEGGRRVLKRKPQSPSVTWDQWRKEPDVFA